MAGSSPTGPLGVTTGPDGALWFTESNAGQIARCALTTINSHDFNADGKSDIAWRTASGALAATKTHNIAPSHDLYYTVYNPAGAYVGSDPDINVRFELNRDWGRGH